MTAVVPTAAPGVVPVVNSPYMCASYYSEISGDLRFACRDQNFFVPWRIETVDSAGDVGMYTSLAFNSRKNPFISYYAQSGGDLKIATKNGSAWNIEVIDQDGDTGLYSSLVIDKEDSPWVAYYNKTDQTVIIARFSNGAWEKHVIEKVGEYKNNTNCVSLAVTDDEVPYIAYRSQDTLKIATLKNKQWFTMQVDPAVGSGLFCSLALYPNGSPAISYFEASSHHLKFAYPNGAAWQFMDVDLRKDIGKYNSLAIGPDGMANISYFDEDHDDLIYARMAGSRWADPELVDQFENVGTFSSLAFDPTGKASITYYYLKGKYLRFALRAGDLWTVQTVDPEPGTGKYSSLKFPHY